MISLSCCCCMLDVLVRHDGVGLGLIVKMECLAKGDGLATHGCSLQWLQVVWLGLSLCKRDYYTRPLIINGCYRYWPCMHSWWVKLVAPLQQGGCIVKSSIKKSLIVTKTLLSMLVSCKLYVPFADAIQPRIDGSEMILHITIRLGLVLVWIVDLNPALLKARPHRATIPW